jgi:hypothetical protein
MLAISCQIPAYSYRQTRRKTTKTDLKTDKKRSRTGLLAPGPLMCRILISWRRGAEEAKNGHGSGEFFCLEGP